MNIFKLPDLGEGLPDAEVHEWFVREGDTVRLDQPLVSMETAKAVVDVPCPQDGIITKLYGKPGDIIKTGEPLVEFKSVSAKPADSGTVVGNLEESSEVSEDHFVIGSSSQSQRSRATPMVRALAKKLNVDLSAINGSGQHGIITQEDVEKAAGAVSGIPEGFEVLRGVRRAMLASMNQSHREVVPVSIFDEADIDAWMPETDITVRLLQAMIYACGKEPALNAWFDSATSSRKCFKEVNIGLAMDSGEGLFVPVIHHAENQTAEELRKTIEAYKHSVQDRNVAPQNLKGSTITLSNFGKFAGKFASPVIVPPSVAILAVGRMYKAPVVLPDGTLKAHRLLPLSLSFDHRGVTGGEATRFLGYVIEQLIQA